MDGTIDYSASLIVTHYHDAFERLEAQITELWAHLNAATYKLLVLIAKFDRERAYERHGLVNTAQWLNWQCGIGAVAAREKVRVARALEELPQISAAFASGEISYSKVRAMTRVATPANEPVLVGIARHGTASHVEKLVRKYRWTQRRDAAKQAETQQLSREVHYFYDEDDNFVLHARLPPEVGAIVLKALQTAGDILREQSRAETDTPPECFRGNMGDEAARAFARREARGRAAAHGRNVPREHVRGGRRDRERGSLPGRRTHRPSGADERNGRRGR